MSNVTYFKTCCSILYCAPMWFNCTKTALTKLKVAYNNYSLRRCMSLPWHNSASEIFVSLNMKSFSELLRVFRHGFRSRMIISMKFICQVFVIVHVVVIGSYGLDGEHYCNFICDWQHVYGYSLRNALFSLQ